jgi:crotonobetaine/carnitine-CoA ligase
MRDPATFGTLTETFTRTVARFGAHDAYMVPPMAGRPYHPDGRSWTWNEAHAEVERRKRWYAAAGYGAGHRIAYLFDQRPEFVFHHLAANALGISVVPLNPDHRPDELSYVLGHSRATLVLGIESRLADLREAIRPLQGPPQLHAFDDLSIPAPEPQRPRDDVPLGPASEAGILYTSGTTGRPKGCVLTNEYFHTFGMSLVNRGGLLELREGVERLYNPLPLHHANAFAISLPATLITGNCFVFPDRFHASTWWDDIATCRITATQFQGVIPNILLKLAPHPRERDHLVRWALCAGIEPNGHALFEERFGFPLVEMWAMSETGRLIAAHDEPRMIDTRAFGRNYPGFDGRIVDADDNEVPNGTPGQFVVRNSEAEPRRGFCNGYLDNPEATEEVWRGEWFHTGDVATRGDDGMFFFVERANNIIRRSGENIAAAEVEACIVAHPGVRQTAVIAVRDELREEELMACIVVRETHVGDETLARDVVAHCLERLAAFKAPGWVMFLDSLPTTSSQKVRKVQLFPVGTDPRNEPGALDLRDLKGRTKVSR